MLARRGRQSRVAGVLAASLLSMVGGVAAQPAGPPPGTTPDEAAIARASARCGGPVVDVERQGHDVAFIVAGPAPGWDALREVGRAVRAELEAVDPAARVDVWFRDGGVVARAGALPGGAVHVEVGDGVTMLDERAAYSLAARAHVDVNRDPPGGVPTWATRPVCAGTVENPGAAPADVAVRCRVHGVHVDRVGLAKDRVVLRDELHALGRLAPHARRRFTFRLPAVTFLELASREPIIDHVDADVSFELGGAPAPHLDLDRLDRASAWLRVLDALRADGVTVHDYVPLAPPILARVYDRVVLDAPADLPARAARERTKLARRWWKLVADHHRRFHVTMPSQGLVVVAGEQQAPLGPRGLGDFTPLPAAPAAP